MDKSFASADYTAGQLNAMVKNLQAQAGEDAPDRLLRGDLTVAEPERSWRGEEPLVIHFSVTSDGTDGQEWIDRLEKAGFRLSRWAEDPLLSTKFQPTDGVTYNIDVLLGRMWNNDERTTKNVRANAEGRQLAKPNVEVACLIREKFSDAELEAMGLTWLVTMHEPIEDSDGSPNLLTASRGGGGQLLHANYDDPDDRWLRDSGFAFVASQE